MLCRIDMHSPPESQMMDVMADRLSEALAMLGRGRFILGRKVDADGCVKEHASAYPSWRVIELEAIGMGKNMRSELSDDFCYAE